MSVDMEGDTVFAFTYAVDALCNSDYDVQDGGDLCHHLIESGEIRIEDGIEHAARVVAQRIQQP